LLKGVVYDVTRLAFPLVSTTNTSPLGNGSPRKVPDKVRLSEFSVTCKSRRVSISGEPGTSGFAPCVVKMIDGDPSIKELPFIKVAEGIAVAV
jgi:hypothetical protein